MEAGDTIKAKTDRGIGYARSAILSKLFALIMLMSQLDMHNGPCSNQLITLHTFTCGWFRSKSVIAVWLYDQLSYHQINNAFSLLYLPEWRFDLVSSLKVETFGMTSSGERLDFDLNSLAAISAAAAASLVSIVCRCRSTVEPSDVIWRVGAASRCSATHSNSCIIINVDDVVLSIFGCEYLLMSVRHLWNVHRDYVSSLLNNWCFKLK